MKHDKVQTMFKTLSNEQWTAHSHGVVIDNYNWNITKKGKMMEIWTKRWRWKKTWHKKWKKIGMQSRETNETSNSKRKNPIWALITLYFCSILITTSTRYGEVLMDVIAMARSSEYLFTANNDCSVNHSFTHTYTHIAGSMHIHKSFDDNWAFYYALKDLFSIVFHKLVLNSNYCDEKFMYWIRIAYKRSGTWTKYSQSNLHVFAMCFTENWATVSL